MKLSTLFIGSAMLFACTVQAQQTPWAQLPVVKTIPTLEGGEQKLRLKLDTLLQQKDIHPHSAFYYIQKQWYNTPSPIIGYGYITENGQPFGIWRYYTLTGNIYELFCEGQLESLSPDQLVIDEEIRAKFSSHDFKEDKQWFIKNLKEAVFFTGEWRFYKSGKLDRILTLDRKVRLPLDESYLYNEKAEHNSTQLTIALPEKIRLAGSQLSGISFSPEGQVTHVWAHGIDLKFGKDGRPVITPLAEPTFVE